MTQLFTNIAASCGGDNFFSLPTWYKYLEKDAARSAISGKCEVAFHLMKDDKFNGDDVILVALSVIDILIRISALVALFFVMYGGIKYITSQGSPDTTKAAQSTIQNALLGMTIAVVAAAFVAYLGNAIN